MEEHDSEEHKILFRPWAGTGGRSEDNKVEKNNINQEIGEYHSEGTSIDRGDSEMIKSEAKSLPPPVVMRHQHPPVPNIISPLSIAMRGLPWAQQFPLLNPMEQVVNLM